MTVITVLCFIHSLEVMHRVAPESRDQTLSVRVSRARVSDVEASECPVPQPRNEKCLVSCVGVDTSGHKAL